MSVFVVSVNSYREDGLLGVQPELLSIITSVGAREEVIAKALDDDDIDVRDIAIEQLSADPHVWCVLGADVWH